MPLHPGLPAQRGGQELSANSGRFGTLATGLAAFIPKVAARRKASWLAGLVGFPAGENDCENSSPLRRAIFAGLKPCTPACPPFGADRRWTILLGMCPKVAARRKASWLAGLVGFPAGENDCENSSPLRRAIFAGLKPCTPGCPPKGAGRRWTIPLGMCPKVAARRKASWLAGLVGFPAGENDCENSSPLRRAIFVVGVEPQRLGLCGRPSRQHGMKRESCPYHYSASRFSTQKM